MRKVLSVIILCLSLTGWAQTKDLILGGELSNSAATSVEDIDEVMPRMKALGLNTVLVPAYWELMEPTEGKFDFTLIDSWANQEAIDKHHATPMMDTIVRLREKYDLHMTVERYSAIEMSETENQFIRR